MSKRNQYIIIFLTVFIHLIGFGIVIPVLPLYAQQFGASPVTVGWLLASYSIFQCVCAPLLGKLSDRVGRKPVLILSMLGTAIGFLVMGMANVLWVLFLGRIIDGITGGNISTAQAYIADITPPEHRSRGMGIIGASFGLGFIFGPAIGGLLGHVSAAAPLYFASALALVNTVVLIFALPESLTPEQLTKNEKSVALRAVISSPSGRILLAIMGTYFLETIAFSLLTATFPLYTKEVFGYGVRANGYVFASIGIVSAIIQGGLLGRLVKRFGERSLVLTGAVCSGAAFFLLPLAGGQVALWLTTALLASGHGLMVAPLNGLASRNMAAEMQGRVLGLMQSTASLGRIAGPILGGVLLNRDLLQHSLHLGRSPYWAAGALVVLAIAAFQMQRASRPVTA